MAKQANKRSVFHSILTKDGWAVMLENEALSLHELQSESEREATALAKQELADGRLAQVVFHKSDGVIREEHTIAGSEEIAGLLCKSSDASREVNGIRMEYTDGQWIVFLTEDGVVTHQIVNNELHARDYAVTEPRRLGTPRSAARGRI